MLKLPSTAALLRAAVHLKFFIILNCGIDDFYSASEFILGE